MKYAFGITRLGIVRYELLKLQQQDGVQASSGRMEPLILKQLFRGWSRSGVHSERTLNETRCKLELPLESRVVSGGHRESEILPYRSK
jgi:hypothetical protein